MLSHFFIDRPIFACVICLVITLLGWVSLQKLPVEQFPDIVPPTVTVSANYPGASAEEVANAVAIPLEQQINGVDNMLYLSTSCTSDGMMQITITFEVGTDPDVATILVQNRVKMAEPMLPEEVRRYGVNVNKRSSSFVLFLSIFEKLDRKTGLGDESATDAEKSKKFGIGISGALAELADNEAEQMIDSAAVETKSGAYLANYASLYVRDRLKRVKGVGDITLFDNRQFSMRIWLDEDAIAARGISAQEIYAVIRAQNTQVSAGRIGLSPIRDGIQKNFSVVTLGRLSEVSQFENILIHTEQDGTRLYLKDIATIELGAESYVMEARYNGQTSTGMALSPRSGANLLEVSRAAQAELEAMKESLARSGLEYSVTFDVTSFIQESVRKFQETLILCVCFVVFTVFMFLQDWRAALIPTLTIPVSIIGTFFLMEVFGFTINTMTLFGLILVIGIVVDDAIIVVENTQRIIDTEHLPPREAAKKSMNEVFGPVVATVLVMMAIFLPTAAMTGIIGQLYQQFALTIAGAVGISGICGVTLAPALCGILLRPSIPKSRKKLPFRIFNFFFDGFAAFYLRTVKVMIRLSPLVMISWCLLICLLLVAFQGLPSFIPLYFKGIPKGFLPDEDQGVAFVMVRLPEGATQERTAKVLAKAEKLVLKHGEGIRGMMLVNGFSFQGSGSNMGFIILPLKPWGERRSAHLHAEAIKNRMQAVFKEEIMEAEFQVMIPPPIFGLGISSGVDYQLIDQRDFGSVALAQTLNDFKEKVTAPEDDGIPVGTIVMALTSFDPNSPRLYLDIDREKAQSFGLSMTEVFAALQMYVGSAYINDFNKFSRTFRVNAQAKGTFRDNPDGILRIKVKNNRGEMVPLSSFVTVKETSGPQQLTRFNLFPSANMIGIVRGDKSTGEAIEKVEALSAAYLPDGYSYEWQGLTLQEKKIGNQTLMIFVLSLLFGYLILCAQYESWSTPLIIMMAVPLGVTGALIGVIVFGLAYMYAGQGGKVEINMYTQLGLILMIGLSAKNAILITEFAREKRHHGLSLVQSAFEGGRLRLRPILMTSFAFILGVTPFVFASGAGANSQRAVGSCVFGGLLTETMVGVYVSPVLFVVMQGISEFCEKRINATLEYGRKKAERSAALEESVIRHGD